MRPASGRPSLAAMSCTRAWASWHVARTMRDRKSTRLNSSHLGISYAVFCLKKKKKEKNHKDQKVKRRTKKIHKTNLQRDKVTKDNMIERKNRREKKT